MSSTTVRVPAKINLALGVGAVGSDGLHALATVYQAVDLCDEVRASVRDDAEVTVTVHRDGDGERDDVPLDGTNLAVRAALALREATGVTDGVSLAIRKVIPVAGGMAGGSADAAATLVACDELWGTGLGRAGLEPIAATLGSDVPFCLHGGTAVGGGHGEQISPVLARGSYQWVFAIAERGLSTAAVYGEFDAITDGVVTEPVVPDQLMSALRAGDAEALGQALSNDLQPAALRLRPELEETLAVGRQCGALGALLSGSGPTAMFLAGDDQHAMDIAVALAAARVCVDVVQAAGPVSGARVVG
ncbi:4-(cytidine 5'-diphospho)-2-C-methyl-D-erythritol kinase [Solicola sp. PLA-1-18]|uniref:4-(cytidine 5'-diphospho)-2-C-methyl-D-erythritol kinase n=1 Tax=Solicola sp. PLA-1-18 TaxID=3380532 RepID=UPI003B774B0D